MKPSTRKLGLEVQLFMLRHGLRVEDLASEIGLTADALSNLIHGHRRFKDETLEKLSQTPLFTRECFDLRRLRALRAVDDYTLEELMLAVMEYIRRGEAERLEGEFFPRFQAELEKAAFPPALWEKKQALASLAKKFRGN